MDIIVSRLPWAIIGAFLLFQAAGYGIDALNYSQISQQPSPDGRKTIFEFRAFQEAKEHAPYGTTLSLSYNKSIHNPDSGYVFFAGYCAQPMTYSWKSNEKIVVNCQSSKENRIPRTQAIVMYGIAVELNTD